MAHRLPSQQLDVFSGRALSNGYLISPVEYGNSSVPSAHPPRGKLSYVFGLCQAWLQIL